MLGPDALAWRDRHYGQSSCPQGRRRARENRGNRRNAAAPTPLFSRSQSDRAVLRKTQSSPAQVRRALHPRPLGSNRNNPPDLHSRRVQQLLHTRRIWAKMRGIRSSYGQGLEFDLRRAIRRIPGYVLLLFLWGIFWEMIVDHRQNFVASALMLAPDVVLANIALVLLGWVFFVRWSRLGNLFVLVAILYALPQLPALLARDLGTFLKPELNLTTIFYVLAGGKVLLAYGFLSLLCSSVLPGIKVNERKLWPADRVPHDFLPSIGRGRVADFILAIVFALIAVPIAEPLWRLIAALVPAQIMH